MSIQIKVPMLPESVADATIITWHKKAGEMVKRDENIVDLETDKVVLEVPAPDDGILVEILKKEGAIVKAGEILATLSKDATMKTVKTSNSATETVLPHSKKSEQTQSSESGIAGPAVRRFAAEQGIPLGDIQGSGKSGRVTRQDVLSQTTMPQTAMGESVSMPNTQAVQGDRIEKRVPMTRLRAIIAKRLVEVQHSAAILTTFNEVNLQKVIELRARYKESFEKKHQSRLGFMSFFTKAVIAALKVYPAVNASIDGNDVV
ncbi:MAG: biotin/lipoyl-containing protein, partial [Rickettsiella sp.]|nr:biotin/lipoyl-containing protein [Rickettsiella sp.]